MLYFLKTKFGGKKAVKLVNEVNIVRISASTSVLCKKNGQLASILRENCVLNSESAFFVFYQCLEKQIRGRSNWYEESADELAYVPLLIGWKIWTYGYCLLLKSIAVMLLLVKCYDKKHRFRCLLSGHLTIGQAFGA